MSSVLYYSKYCENCKKLLYQLGKSNIQKNIHFLSIDKRINRGGIIYIILDNGNEIFVGDDVINFFNPQISQEKIHATQNNMEPLAFSMFEMGTSMSDTYSYLDQTPNEMEAKGEGGLRQMHSFVKLNHNDNRLKLMLLVYN